MGKPIRIKKGTILQRAKGMLSQRALPSDMQKRPASQSPAGAPARPSLVQRILQREPQPTPELPRVCTRAARIHKNVMDVAQRHGLHRDGMEIHEALGALLAKGHVTPDKVRELTSQYGEAEVFAKGARPGSPLLERNPDGSLKLRDGVPILTPGGETSVPLMIAHHRELINQHAQRLNPDSEEV